MIKTLKLLVLFLLPVQTYATGQSGDILIWKGDTSFAFSNPLESRKDVNQLRLKFFSVKPPWNTACWRGYVAEWTIVDNQLYLTKIFSCDYPDKKTADLKSLFGNEFIDGKVKANWFTGEILLPKGKQLLYDHMGYNAYYEREIILDLKDGQLKSHQEYSYPNSHESAYSRRPDSLQNFIYSHINWKIIPPLADKKVRVLVILTSGDTGKPDSIRVLRSVSENVFNEEAVRVLNLLPDWNVYYTRGKVLNRNAVIPVWFDEEKRKKYSQ